uniref:Disease resistance protein At4g27190-like leucine-rich repeats domain-containing protein n=1 Tax=Oryza punctata TaxID=4537 RepID=A0A0E0M5M0_ORYPU
MTIYFHGWCGFGASAVLRSVADEITSMRDYAELCIEKVIHIDCSTWKSRRAMQRAIAVELNLDASVMEAFGKADEEDDFSGVGEGSRSEIMSVAGVINQTLRDQRFMVVFHNGSADDIDIGSFGISRFTTIRPNLVLWTFGRRLQASEDSIIKNRVKNAQLFAYESAYTVPRKGLILPVLRKESTAIAANYPCMQKMDPERIVQCCLYGLFIYLCVPKNTQHDWQAQASDYWMCDCIMQDDLAEEISSALSKEIKWDLHPDLLDEFGIYLLKSSTHNHICFRRLRFGKYNPHQTPTSYPWISIVASKILETRHLITENEEVSSYFFAPENHNDPLVLPDGLFNQSTNLHVLQLSYCAFSFASPPFTSCRNLRFLGLDHCKDSKTSKQNDLSKWQFLHSLWVLHLNCTYWYQLFSEETADHIINLRNLHRLRLINSMGQPNLSMGIDNFFINKTKLKILDLSGNTSMENLPNNLSEARGLEVLILDGCGGLENVVSDELPFSLRSFSMDGYGPALKLASPVELPTINLRPSFVDTEVEIKTSMISLKGCTQLENLFLRWLPNLLELDLSGTAIKILDFTTMVMGVSSLKRLFLLGCTQFRAIKWESNTETKLELLCIDTRPGMECPRPSVDNNKSLLHVHAFIVDARLARSLLHPIINNWQAHFNIHVTSSMVYNRVVHPQGGSCKDKTGQSSDQVNLQEHVIQTNLWQKLVPIGQYHDVLKMVGENTMQSFTQPPTEQLSRHVEIAEGSRNLESELDENSPHRTLAHLVKSKVQSLHMHDASSNASLPGGERWYYLKRCRIERCPNLKTVFPADACDFLELETVLVLDLLMAHCIWRKGFRRSNQCFKKLRHLHLCSCPNLKFVLPVWVSSFPYLETIYVIDCSDLRNIFVLDGNYPNKIGIDGVKFQTLTTIHLHALPMLQHICEVKMVAPVLKTIKTRGCLNLRRLPVVTANEPKPTVEIEKDVWDALEWDGLKVGHHPSLFKAPLHSHYYRKKLPRVSVLG